jgi:hypothetical protein
MYAEPFDSAIDAFVGGASSWSSSRAAHPGNPSAKLAGEQLTITLHEDGPVFDWLLQNWDQIPNIFNSIAAIVSAWYAARTYRKSQLPKGDVREKREARIKVGDVELIVEKDLPAEQLAKLAKAVAEARAE